MRRIAYSGARCREDKTVAVKTVEKTTPRGKELMKSCMDFTELRALLSLALEPQGDETKPLSAQKFLSLADPEKKYLWSNTTFFGVMIGTAGPDGERREHMPDMMTLFVLAIGINRRLGTFYSGEDLWHMLLGSEFDYPADAAPNREGVKPRKAAKAKPEGKAEAKPYQWTGLLVAALELAEKEEEDAVLMICRAAKIGIERLQQLRKGEHPTHAEACAIAGALPFIKVDSNGDIERVYEDDEVIALASPYSR
jgi:hypothetical protein